MSVTREQDWEMEIRTVWEASNTLSGEEVVTAIDALADLRPGGDPAAFYERASARDYAGLERDAEPLYRRALDAGLDHERRPRAVIQLASTLRNLGRTDEAVSLLTRDVEASPDDGLDDARAAFLALALHDAGHHGRALSTVLTALAPHLPAYNRAVLHYAAHVTQ
ncbi:MAG: tetratricopeptide repeat protein [Jatrophihabitantaceae bacterium]